MGLFADTLLRLQRVHPISGQCDGLPDAAVGSGMHCRPALAHCSCPGPEAPSRLQQRVARSLILANGVTSEHDA